MNAASPASILPSSAWRISSARDGREDRSPPGPPGPPGAAWQRKSAIWFAILTKIVRRRVCPSDRSAWLRAAKLIPRRARAARVRPSFWASRSARASRARPRREPARRRRAFCAISTLTRLVRPIARPRVTPSRASAPATLSSALCRPNPRTPPRALARTRGRPHGSTGSPASSAGGRQRGNRRVDVRGWQPAPRRHPRHRASTCRGCRARRGRSRPARPVSRRRAPGLGRARPRGPCGARSPAPAAPPRRLSISASPLDEPLGQAEARPRVLEVGAASPSSPPGGPPIDHGDRRLLRQRPARRAADATRARPAP